MRLKKIIKEIWRFPLRLCYKYTLKNKNFTLLSSNCIGGGWYHDTFNQFNSPTINLTIQNSIYFFEHFEELLHKDIVDGGIDGFGHPVGVLGETRIIGVHYNNFNDLKQSWDRRKKRINYKNIFLITTDEFIISDEELKRFNDINFPKVCFVNSIKKIKYTWQVYIPGFESFSYIGDSMKYCTISGKRYNEKFFDFIGFLNKKY